MRVCELSLFRRNRLLLLNIIELTCFLFGSSTQRGAANRERCNSMRYSKSLSKILHCPLERKICSSSRLSLPAVFDSIFRCVATSCLPTHHFFFFLARLPGAPWISLSSSSSPPPQIYSLFDRTTSNFVEPLSVRTSSSSPSSFPWETWYNAIPHCS